MKPNAALPIALAVAVASCTGREASAPSPTPRVVKRYTVADFYKNIEYSGLSFQTAPGSWSPRTPRASGTPTSSRPREGSRRR